MWDLRICRDPRRRAPRGHDGCPGPPRPGRRRLLPGGRSRARTPAAVHHRRRGRAPADRERGRERRPDRERRDLQLPRASPRPRGPRAPLPHAVGLRGDLAPVRGAGRRLRRTPQRNVRLCPLRPPPAPPAAGPRSPGHQAALLRGASGRPAVRVGDEGATPSPGLRSDPRSPRRARLPRAALRPRSRQHVPRGAQTARGPHGGALCGSSATGSRPSIGDRSAATLANTSMASPSASSAACAGGWSPTSRWAPT